MATLLPPTAPAAETSDPPGYEWVALSVTTVGALLAGLPQSGARGWDLVAYRVIQGIGGALLITNSTAIVADAFKHGRVGLGLGVNQVAGAAGFLLGPVVGGLLTTPFGAAFLLVGPLSGYLSDHMSMP